MWGYILVQPISCLISELFPITTTVVEGLAVVFRGLLRFNIPNNLLSHVTDILCSVADVNNMFAILSKFHCFVHKLTPGVSLVTLVILDCVQGNIKVVGRMSAIEQSHGVCSIINFSLSIND